MKIIIASLCKSCKSATALYDRARMSGETFFSRPKLRSSNIVSYINFIMYDIYINNIMYDMIFK